MSIIRPEDIEQFMIETNANMHKLLAKQREAVSSTGHFKVVKSYRDSETHNVAMVIKCLTLQDDGTILIHVRD